MSKSENKDKHTESQTDPTSDQLTLAASTEVFLPGDLNYIFSLSLSTSIHLLYNATLTLLFYYIGG